MLRPYDLLETVLIDVEKGIRTGINVDILAKSYSMSFRHLQRIFKAAFKQTLTDYVRSRKLAVSLDDLLKTDLNLLDIALEYGFSYEQTYIRAFKREYRITPGYLRKLCCISDENFSLRFYLRKINIMETNILNVIYNDYFETYSLDYRQGFCWWKIKMSEKVHLGFFLWYKKRNKILQIRFKGEWKCPIKFIFCYIDQAFIWQFVAYI